MTRYDSRQPLRYIQQYTTFYYHTNLSLRYTVYEYYDIMTGMNSWDTDFMARGQSCVGASATFGLYMKKMLHLTLSKHTVQGSTWRRALDYIYKDARRGRGRRELLKNCTRVYSLPES